MSYTRYGLFSFSSGMAVDLLNKNRVNLNAWGTDKDIKDCLGEDLTINPNHITQPGIYIFTPVSLTEAIDAAAMEAIKWHLTEALNAIRSNQVNGKISLLIPVNSENNHWRLARIYVRDQQITSALLWDSCGGKTKILRAQAAFANFQKACNEVANPEKQIRIIMKITNVQRNSHSCMDYVLQEIYRIINRENAITNADNERSLRLAVVKQIASRHPQLKHAADTLTITRNGFIAPIITIADGAENITSISRPETEIRLASIVDLTQTNAFAPLIHIQKKIQRILDSTPIAQDVFDELYANELQNLFNSNCENHEFTTYRAMSAAYHKLKLWLNEQQHIHDDVAKLGMR